MKEIVKNPQDMSRTELFDRLADANADLSSLRFTTSVKELVQVAYFGGLYPEHSLADTLLSSRERIEVVLERNHPAIVERVNNDSWVNCLVKDFFNRITSGIASAADELLERGYCFENWDRLDPRINETPQESYERRLGGVRGSAHYLSMRDSISLRLI